MSKPNFYGIFYEINPWMSVEKPVTQQLAQSQWDVLYQTLLDIGVSIKLIEPVDGLPDMVFTANAALVHQNEAWISVFKSVERQPESKYFEAWFAKQGYEIMNPASNNPNQLAFEGAGDALFFGEHLAVGYGFRSDRMAYDHPYFKQFKLVFCELVDPYFYHLDTCFVPLNASLALWFPDAFSPESQKSMHKMGQLIAVPAEEARRFACNAVVINQHVVLPSGCPETCRLLREHGFTVHECDMSEYIKSGGACKCLTIIL